jgi:hypothetical protein
VREELPSDIEAALSSMRSESPVRETASLFPDEVKSPHQKKVLRLLTVDGSTHMDQRGATKAKRSRSKICAAIVLLACDLDLLSSAKFDLLLG